MMPSVPAPNIEDFLGGNRAEWVVLDDSPIYEENGLFPVERKSAIEKSLDKDVNETSILSKLLGGLSKKIEKRCGYQSENCFDVHKYGVSYESGVHGLL